LLTLGEQNVNTEIEENENLWCLYFYRSSFLQMPCAKIQAGFSEIAQILLGFAATYPRLPLPLPPKQSRDSPISHS
jgi:hypothetical protein